MKPEVKSPKVGSQRAVISRGQQWVVVALSVLIGMWVVNMGNGGSAPVEAGQTHPTYNIYDIEIEYPYVDPRSGVADPQRAGVSHLSSWATATYPGEAECEIVLQDAAGNTAGRLPFGLSSGTAEPSRSSLAPVQVSSPPTSGVGKCAESVYPTGPGYVFEQPSLSRPEDRATGRPDERRTAITFVSQWATVESPGLRTCWIDLKVNGKSTSYGPYNVQLPDGEPLVITPPIADPRAISEPAVRCSEFDG